MKDHKPYKQIFSLRLAGYLMYNGMRIRGIQRNLKLKDKDIYLFENNEHLSQLIGEYSVAKRNQKNK